jgi:hypothetical protein
MKKGIAPIAIAALIFLGIVLIWGVAIHFFIGENASVTRSSRETEIIKMINEMEWTKRLMPQILEHSFYQSSYSLASNGGYFDPNSVSSHNCIPYWKIYDDVFYPDIEDNLNKSIISYMSKYASNLRIRLPEYQISYQQEDDSTVVNIKSKDMLEIERNSVKVEDESEYTVAFSENPFQIFETGKTDFIDNDVILQAITNSGTSCDDQKGIISSELKKLENDRTKLAFDEDNDIQVDCNGHAAVRVLVTIIGSENKYPVYDFLLNTTEMRNIQLKFYVVSGNANLIEPEIDQCS